MNLRHFVIYGGTLLGALVIAMACRQPAGADVVINEIFYHAPDELDELEYIELYNTDMAPADLGGWSLARGVKFKFPQGMQIAGQGFLVIAGNAELFTEFYGTAPEGVFKKSLNNHGDEVQLLDARGKLVEAIKYSDAAPWPVSADAYSASLERICPTGPANDPTNWAPSRLSNDSSKLPGGTPGAVNSVHAAATPPAVGAVSWEPQVLAPRSELSVTVEIDPAVSISEGVLKYSLNGSGAPGEVQAARMTLAQNGQWTARISSGTEGQQLLRFHVEVTGQNGGVARVPALYDLRPEYTVYVGPVAAGDRIPVIQIFHIDPAGVQAGEQYLQEQLRPPFGPFGRGGEPTPEERQRFAIEFQLMTVSLSPLWADLTLTADRSIDDIARLSPLFQEAQAALEAVRAEFRDGAAVDEFAAALPGRLKAVQAGLAGKTAAVLGKADQARVQKFVLAGERGFGPGMGPPDPRRMLKMITRFEDRWYQAATSPELQREQLEPVRKLYREFIARRDGIEIKPDEFDPAKFFETAQSLGEELDSELDKLPGRPARDSGPAGFGPMAGPMGQRRVETPLPPQGTAALVWTDPLTQRTEVYDFINLTRRKSGWKARFHKDRPFHEMTTVNFLYEPAEETVLNEALAYELYGLAGNATSDAGYVRLVLNGKVAGYHLFFEQPNANFLRRHKIDHRGDLYKLIWTGGAEISRRIPRDRLPRKMDIARRYEKKTNRHRDYDDLVALIEGLGRPGISDDERWEFIKANIDVPQVVNYFAVNSLLSHWDGFFNNFFLYFDRQGTGKWSLYPWDQDSTWSLRGGPPEELARMPLNFGAEGARPENDTSPRGSRGGFGGFGRGGFGWWRDGGDLSKPLLAHPRFFKIFETRLRELATTVFTAEVLDPRLERLRADLEPEIRLRARMKAGEEAQALQEFDSTLQNLREHLQRRRAYVLEQTQAAAQ